MITVLLHSQGSMFKVHFFIILQHWVVLQHTSCSSYATHTKNKLLFLLWILGMS